MPHATLTASAIQYTVRHLMCPEPFNIPRGIQILLLIYQLTIYEAKEPSPTCPQMLPPEGEGGCLCQCNFSTPFHNFSSIPAIFRTFPAISGYSFTVF